MRGISSVPTKEQMSQSDRTYGAWLVRVFWSGNDTGPASGWAWVIRIKPDAMPVLGDAEWGRWHTAGSVMCRAPYGSGLRTAEAAFEAAEVVLDQLREALG